jgi:hypothetical protein
LITASVQDARNENVAGLAPVVDDVALHWKAPKADGEFVAPPTGLGMTGEQDDAAHDVVEEVIRDIHTAIAGDIEPHLVEIGLG